MRITTNLHLIGITREHFDNAQTGEHVEYEKATLVDEQGNVFTPSIDKNSNIERKEGKGIATLDLTARNGKLKLKLVDFN